jgi:ferredoxin, 2Fe-2S
MTQIHVTTREGEIHAIEGKDGESLMEAIRGAGIDQLVAMCGGCLSCATCHIYIDNRPDLDGPEGDEADLLEASDYFRASSRLSCQVILEAGLDGLAITIAPED